MDSRPMSVGSFISVIGLWVAVLIVAYTLSTHTHTIEEDTPQWNCATMGNMVCGEDS